MSAPEMPLVTAIAIARQILHEQRNTPLAVTPRMTRREERAIEKLIEAAAASTFPSRRIKG
jgi:hypothetical protein